MKKFERRLGTPRYIQASFLALPQNNKAYPTVYRGTVNTPSKYDIYTCGSVVLARFGERVTDAHLLTAWTNLAGVGLPTPVYIRVAQLLRGLG